MPYFLACSTVTFIIIRQFSDEKTLSREDNVPVFPMSYQNCSIGKCRSSRPQTFFETSVLKKFAILIGKHLCWGLFLIKLQTFRSAALLKRDSNTRKGFPVKFAKILKTDFL